MKKNLKIGKDKYINVLLRFKNKAWTAALLIQLVNVTIFLIRAFGGEVSGDTETNILSIVQVLAGVLSSLVGRFVDSTTEGLADSERNLVKSSPTTNSEKSLQAMDYDGKILPPVKPFLEQESNQETTNLPKGLETFDNEYLEHQVFVEDDEGLIESVVRADANYNPEILGGGSGGDL
ncbi:hypothetical protein [Staphylococcus phage LY01]|nr:hypothetical protein [Staphylococcus phage LY01]